jgi:hypothetical protein
MARVEYNDFKNWLKEEMFHRDHLEGSATLGDRHSTMGFCMLDSHTHHEDIVDDEMEDEDGEFYDPNVHVSKGETYKTLSGKSLRILDVSEDGVAMTTLGSLIPLSGALETCLYIYRKPGFRLKVYECAEGVYTYTLIPTLHDPVVGECMLGGDKKPRRVLAGMGSKLAYMEPSAPSIISNPNYDKLKFTTMSDLSRNKRVWD